MFLVSIDLWDILDGSKESPPSNADPKVKKEYQLAHIKNWKILVEVLNILCNIRKMKILLNIFALHVLHMQDARGKLLGGHINKINRSHIDLLVWKYLWNIKTLSWPCSKVFQHHTNIWLQTWKRCEEESYNGLCKNAFDTRDVDAKRINVRMSPWCWNKAMGTIQFCAKAQWCFCVVANRAIFHNFATK